jgi:hypothetical protein
MQSINFAQHLNTAIIFIKTIDLMPEKFLEGTFYITSNNFCTPYRILEAKSEAVMTIQYNERYN